MRKAPEIALILALGIALAPIAAAQQEGDAAYHFSVAKLLQAEGSFREAAAAYEKAIELAPDAPYLRIEHAEFLAKAGRVRQAAEEADRAIELAPDDLDILKIYGQIRLELASRDVRSLRRAREAYERLRRDRPQDVESMATLARIYLSVGEAEAATAVLEEALTYHPDHPWLTRNLFAALRQSGDKERLAEVLPQLLSGDPGFLQARLELAVLYSEAGDHAAAIEVLEQAPPELLEQLELKSVLARELYQSALMAPPSGARLGQLERAGALTEELLAAQPESQEILYLRALVLAELGRNGAAISELEKLRDKKPDDIRYAAKLVELLEIEGNEDEALSILSGLANDLADSAENQDTVRRLWIGVARIQSRMRRWDAVLDTSRRLDKMEDPRSAEDAALIAAEALSQMGKAEDGLRRLQDADGDSPRIVAERVELLQELGREDEGHRLLQRFARGADEESLRTMTGLLLSSDRPTDLEVALRELIEREDDSEARVELSLLYARTLAESGRARDGLRWIEKEASVLAGSQRYELARATVLAALGETAAADDIYARIEASEDAGELLLLLQDYQQQERFAAMIPVARRLRAKGSEGLTDHGVDLADIDFTLGMALERTGETTEASEAFQRVLQAEPDNGGALNYLAYMWAEKGRNLDEALRMIERAVALEPTNGSFVDSLGWTLYQLGRYEEARQQLELASRLLPDDATILEHLGDVYVALELTERARKIYETVVELREANADGVRRKLASLHELGEP